jgi:hypothetical protein
MKRLFPVILTIFTFFFLGCGNSDDFVFTNTNIAQAGVPAQLAFVQNPAQTTNTDFSTPPIVEVQDAFGNRVPGATNTITVSLVNPGTAVLNGQTTRDAIDGQATFTGLSVSEAGTFTLTCTAQNLASANSATFTVTPSLALYSIASVQGDGDPAQLIQLDPATGEYVGTLGFLESAGTMNFFDLECLPDGTVYALGGGGGSGSDLVLVNMNDPSSSTKAFDITGVDRLFSMAYDANSQTMYATCEQTNGGSDFSLCTIDLTTGVATPAANLFTLIGNGYGLAFDDSTNMLYLASDNDLASVDTATGIDTTIGGGGTIGIVQGSGNVGIKGLDFNPNTNQLFGVSRGGAGYSDTVALAGSISTLNGTSIETGFSPNCAGISFCENPTIPAAGPARQTGYTVSGITQAFEDITGTGSALGFADDDNSLESIGFTFNFDGSDYTMIDINSNGTASFTGSSTDFEAELMPTDFIPGPSLAVFWDDLDPSNSGDVYVQTLGTAPNRRFVIQWAQVFHNDTTPTGGIDAEIVLYETSNVIEFHYADVTFGDPEFDGGKSAAVGIQTSTTRADVWSIFQAALTDTTAIRFAPPAP